MRLIYILFSMMSFSVLAYDSQLTYKLNHDEHHLSFIMQNDSSGKYIATITAFEENDEGVKLWQLFDYIDECELDLTLELDRDSIRFFDVHNDGNKAVLFAYHKSCHGDVSAPEVKYFAYYNGKKFSIKGGGKMMESGKLYGSYDEKVISENLKSEPKLLEYMESHWDDLSTFEIN